jgi:hypothetical protein
VNIRTDPRACPQTLFDICTDAIQFIDIIPLRKGKKEEEKRENKATTHPN